MSIAQLNNIILTAGTDTSSIGDFVNKHLNSDFALGAVFAGIVFICIIAFMRKSSSDENSSNTVEPVSLQENVSNTEVELVDNTELVAVITAAIMAYMGDEAPADGLYIRSIKRSSGNRWKNA